MINIGSELDDSGLEAGGVVKLQEKKYRVLARGWAKDRAFEEVSLAKVGNKQGSPYTPTRVPDFLTKETRFRRRDSYPLIISSINLLLQAGNEGKAVCSRLHYDRPGN